MAYEERFIGGNRFMQVVQNAHSNQDCFISSITYLVIDMTSFSTIFLFADLSLHSIFMHLNTRPCGGSRQYTFPILPYQERR